jgi:hypothetical protein
MEEVNLIKDESKNKLSLTKDENKNKLSTHDFFNFFHRRSYNYLVIVLLISVCIILLVCDIMIYINYNRILFSCYRIYLFLIISKKFLIE